MVRKLLIIVPVILALTVVSLFMPARHVTIEGIGKLSFETAVTLSIGQQEAYASPDIAFVNEANGYGEGSDTTIAAAAANHTAGNLLVVLTSADAAGSPTVTSVTDTAGNTYYWTGQRSPYTPSENGWTEIWYAKDITGNASNVVTAQFSTSATYRAISVHQYSGADASDPYDVGNTGSGESTSLSTAAATTTQANEVIVACYTAYDPGTWTAGTNFTLRYEGTYFATEDRFVSSIGSYGSTMTCSITTEYSACHATFKAAPPAPWLGDWCKRVKITIDKDDFDENVTHFPVLIYLSSACGIGNAYDLTPVFDEVGSNSKRIAVTEDDGETQLYVEIEKWDAGAEKAWLWVSKSGWTISSTVDTVIYLYYCNTQPENTTYVGDSGSRTEVWNSNFQGVWHLCETGGGGEGWLSDWAKRVKLTVDSGDISAALSNFPILLYISPSSGYNSDDISCVFDELQSDANRFKIAVTETDGTTECKVEIEKWDDASEKAWLWVKAPSIASGSNTDFYLYYDNTQPDNPNVGDCSDGSAATHAVWDDGGSDYFKFVDHLRDKPDTSHTRDSTQYNNDGTKYAAGQPAVTTAGIGDAQTFDGSNDYINCGTNDILNLTGDFTISVWIKLPDMSGEDIILGRANAGYTLDTGEKGYYLLMRDLPPDTLIFNIAGLGSSGSAEWAGCSDDVWHHVVGVRNGNNIYLWVDNDMKESDYGSFGDMSASGETLRIGCNRLGGEVFAGLIDEIRISTTIRTNAWIAAEYETGRDHLLDWGTEETSGIQVDAVSTNKSKTGDVTVSHKTGSGENRLMLVGISAALSGGIAVTGVTYGSASLTLVGTDNENSYGFMWIYKLVPPDTGTDNVVVSFDQTPSSGAFVGVITFTGVDQDTPLGTFEGADGTGTTASVNVSSAAGELVFDTVTAWLRALTVGTGQTERWCSWSDNTQAGGSTEPGAATVTMSWTLESSGDWVIGAVPIKPAPSVKDSTSNANHCTDSGNPTFGAAGKIDNAIDFDGSDDVLEDADAELYINGLTAITLEAYVESDVTGTDRGVMVGEPPSGNDRNGFRYDSSGYEGSGTNVIKAGFTVSGTDQTYESASNVQTTDWQHIVVTWSSGNYIGMYIDGTLDTPTWNETPQTGSISNSTTLLIGKGAMDASSSWDGIIDEVRISDSARSAAWIKATYETERDELLDFGTEETPPEVDISNIPTSYDFGNVTDAQTYATGLDYFTVTNNSGASVDITIKGTDMASGGGTPTYVAYAEADVEESANTQINVPAGTQDDDFMAAILISCRNADTDGSAMSTPASGWTYVDDWTNSATSGQHFYLYYRIASSEPANYTWTWADADCSSVGSISTFRGADTDDPIHVLGNELYAGSGVDVSIPSITTTANNCLVVVYAVCDDDDEDAAGDGRPSGSTWIHSVGTAGDYGCGLSLGYYEHATPGPTGDKTWTIDASEEHTGQQFALQPAPGYIWTLSDTCTPAEDVCGFKAGLESGSYNIIVRKNSPYNDLVTNLGDSATQKWGLDLYTPTNITQYGEQLTGTITLTATLS